MNIAGAHLDRLADEQLDQPDHGRVLAVLLDFSRARVEAEVALRELRQHIVHGGFLDTVILVDGLVHRVRRGQHATDIAVEIEAQVVHRIQVERVGQRDDEDTILLADGNKVMLSRDGLGHRLDRLGRHADASQIGETIAEQFSQRSVDVVPSRRFHLHQGLADAQVRPLALHLKRLADLLLCDDALLDQNLTKGSLSFFGHDAPPRYLRPSVKGRHSGRRGNLPLKCV